MKAKLTFILPEEKTEHLAAVSGMDMACALFDLRNYLRSRMKYGSLSDEAYKELERVSEELNSHILSLAVDIDSL